MKVTIFSDVHGDIYSLKELFLRENSDQFICLGDLVGYGPHSNACLDLAIEKCGEGNVILGNHEEMFLSGSPHSGCSELAMQFFDASYHLYENDTRITDFKNEISLTLKGNKEYRCCHTLEQRHIYPNSEIRELKESFIIGHSHIQFYKPVLSNEAVINTGSLGQNRVNKDIANYINIDVETGAIEFKSFYSPKTNLIKDMKKLNYNSRMIQYYES